MVLSAVGDRVEIRMRLKCSERHYKPSRGDPQQDETGIATLEMAWRLKITLGFQEWRI